MFIFIQKCTNSILSTDKAQSISKHPSENRSFIPIHPRKRPNKSLPTFQRKGPMTNQKAKTPEYGHEAINTAISKKL
jgi:hypothetical protein